MRILFVLPNYEPAWAFGGVVRCISSLCRSMARIGVDVSIYTTNVDGRGGLLPVTPEDPTDVGGVSVTYFPSTFGRNSVWDSHALTRKLDQTIEDFDIVYVAAIWQWIGISVGRLARRHGVPYVVGTHGSFNSVLLEKGKMKKMLYWYLFLRKCLSYASALHLTTEYERRQAHLLRFRYSSFVVPNCMRKEAFEINESLGGRMRKKFHISPEVPVLITVGRPDPKKRLDVILKSFPQVLQHFPQARLMIVGPNDNEYAIEMKRLSDGIGLSDKVIWAGYRTGDDLKGCYAAADLFLLPSMDENFGMAVTEAMALRVPVIISNYIGVAEDVERYNAGIVTKANPEQITRAVIDLLSDCRRLQEMGENARKAALQLYSGVQVANLMLKAFEDILSKSRSPECAWQ